MCRYSAIATTANNYISQHFLSFLLLPNFFSFPYSIHSPPKWHPTPSSAPHEASAYAPLLPIQTTRPTNKHPQYQFLKTLSQQNPRNTIIGTARNPAPVIAQAKSDNLSNVHIIAADMTSPSSLATAAQETASLLPPNTGIDHLIVNGGYMSSSTFALSPVDYTSQPELFSQELRETMETNVAGVLYSVNAFLPLVKKSQIKKVVVITSGFADEGVNKAMGFAAAVPYSLSKVALNQLVLKFALQTR